MNNDEAYKKLEEAKQKIINQIQNEVSILFIKEFYDQQDDLSRGTVIKVLKDMKQYDLALKLIESEITL